METKKIRCVPRLITPEEVRKLATAIVLDSNEATDVVNAALDRLAEREGSVNTLHFHRSQNDEIDEFMVHMHDTALVIELPDHDFDIVHRLRVDYAEHSHDPDEVGKIDVLSDTYAVSRDWSTVVDVTQFAELLGGIGKMSVIGNSLAEVIRRKEEYVLRDMAKCVEINKKKKTNT